MTDGRQRRFPQLSIRPWGAIMAGGFDDVVGLLLSELARVTTMARAGASALAFAAADGNTAIVQSLLSRKTCGAPCLSGMVLRQ